MVSFRDPHTVRPKSSSQWGGCASSFVLLLVLVGTTRLDPLLLLRFAKWLGGDWAATRELSARSPTVVRVVAISRSAVVGVLRQALQLVLSRSESRKNAHLSERSEGRSFAVRRPVLFQWTRMHFRLGGLSCLVPAGQSWLSLLPPPKHPATMKRRRWNGRLFMYQFSSTVDKVCAAVACFWVSARTLMDKRRKSFAEANQEVVASRGGRPR